LRHVCLAEGGHALEATICHDRHDACRSGNERSDAGFQKWVLQHTTDTNISNVAHTAWQALCLQLRSGRIAAGIEVLPKKQACFAEGGHALEATMCHDGHDACRWDPAMPPGDPAELQYECCHSPHGCCKLP
jgi:hypothetical protein